MCWITLINFVARMGEINRLDEPCSVITVILRPLGHAPPGLAGKAGKERRPRRSLPGGSRGRFGSGAPWRSHVPGTWQAQTSVRNEGGAHTLV